MPRFLEVVARSHSGNAECNAPLVGSTVTSEKVQHCDIYTERKARDRNRATTNRAHSMVGRRSVLMRVIVHGGHDLSEFWLAVTHTGGIH